MIKGRNSVCVSCGKNVTRCTETTRLSQNAAELLGTDTITMTMWIDKDGKYLGCKGYGWIGHCGAEEGTIDI